MKNKYQLPIVCKAKSWKEPRHRNGVYPGVVKQKTLYRSLSPPTTCPTGLQLVYGGEGLC